MKISMKKVESFTISSALVTIILLILGTTFSVADGIFGWDLFPEGIQNLLIVFSIMCTSIVTGSFLLNVMVNLSRIAYSAEKLASNKE